MEYFGTYGGLADTAKLGGKLDLGDLGKTIGNNINVGDVGKNINLKNLNIDVGDVGKNIKVGDVGDLGKNIKVGDVGDLGDIGKNIKVGDVGDLGDIAKNVDVGDIAKNVDVVKNAEVGNFKNTGVVFTKNFDSDSALKAGFKNSDEADKVANKLDNIIETNPSFLDRMSDSVKDFVKKNPLKTAGAAILLLVGAVGLAIALKEYEENKDKKVGIVRSYKSNDDIVIEFTPSANIVSGDKVLITNANFEESINNQEIEIKEIKSSTIIVISTTAKITKLANSGELTIHTSIENHIADKANDAGKVVENGVTNVLTTTGKAIGKVGGEIFYIIKPYLIYVCGFIIIICLLCLAYKFLL